ncbi:MAG: DEAD/DEAH box helicase [archaeon]
MSEIKKLKDIVAAAELQFSEVEQKVKQMREQLTADFKALLDKHQISHIDGECLDQFFKEPYVLLPKKGHEYYVIVPKFLKMQVGYLEHSTPSYNVFVVNKYVRWLSEIPKPIQDKLRFPKPLPFKVYEGMLLTGEENQDRAWSDYRKFLHQREGKDKIRIKKGYSYKLVAQLIEEGTLPFIPRPVDESDLRVWKGAGFEKYSKICEEKNIVELQQKTWNTFLEHGAIGIYWAFGAGKSMFGHRIIGSVKGPKLVVVPSVMLKEQWHDRLKKFNPEVLDEVTVETYHSFKKVQKENWTVVIFDEHQHLPANTFINLSTLKTKYRVGCSGSPFREDGRENYIFALTGYPVGMAWEDLLKLQIVKAPQFRVYVVGNKREKDKKLEELLKIPVKTLIFCDSLDYGEQLSRKFEIPFVYGATKDRLEIIRNSQVSVVSRVGDEGLSIADLERVIEVAFLFGSRMQESQRFGRLMHSAKGSQHIIIMTKQEFDRYQKRLRAIVERGFKIEYVF